MKQIITLLVMLSLWLGLFFNLTAFAQTPSDPFGKGYQYFQMPPSSELGASIEAKNILNNLDRQQLEDLQAELRDIIENVRLNGTPSNPASTTESLAFTDSNGVPSFSFAERSSEEPTPFVFELAPPAGTAPTCPQSI